jgi:glyceraldehyde 3-phosphate dehydrogenase
MNPPLATKPIRIGINGFGRIGRALARRIWEDKDLELIVINDIESDLSNLAYLLKFDSIYGRFHADVAAGQEHIEISGKSIRCFSEDSIEKVPWQEFELDVVIEATGVRQNVARAKSLEKGQRVKKVVVTNEDSAVDFTLIYGVNHMAYRREEHFVISSSICDANAIAPVLHYLDKSLGIDSVFITTLHPWLSYQNLLDGPVSSVSSPGHNWSEYALGRSSVGNLILKDTTAGEATLKVLPQLVGKLDAISFRVPTNNVSASDFAINLSTKTTISQIYEIFREASVEFPEVIKLNEESLVSGDFTGLSQSCVIDCTKMKLVGEKFLKLVSWYDNEWAYSCRVLDVVKLTCMQL